MRRVGIKEFRKNLKQYLKEMPVGITKRGDLIGLLVSPSFFDYLVEHGTKSTTDDSGDGDQVQSGILETF
jgi:hypothetical protein